MKIGQYRYSRPGPNQIRYAGDETLPVGGVLIDHWADPETGEIVVRLVALYRGQIRYHTMPLHDTETGTSDGLVRADVLKQMLPHLGKDPRRHLHAITVIDSVLQLHAPSR